MIYCSVILQLIFKVRKSKKETFTTQAFPFPLLPCTASTTGERFCYRSVPVTLAHHFHYLFKGWYGELGKMGWENSSMNCLILYWINYLSRLAVKTKKDMSDDGIRLICFVWLTGCGGRGVPCLRSDCRCRGWSTGSYRKWVRRFTHLWRKPQRRQEAGPERTNVPLPTSETANDCLW